MKNVTYILACVALAIIVFFGLTGCNVSVKEESSVETIAERFVEIPGQSNLYYDSNTKVVYVIFKERQANGHRAYGYGYMSPYYSSNGIPYSYNVETGYLEEIHE